MNSSVWRSSFLLSVLLSCFLLSAHAQYTTSSRPPKLYINSVDSRPEFFEIKYEITAPGYVELHLMDDKNEKLWVTGKVTDRVGVDIHRVPKGPLAPGKRYSFVLKYKGNEYSSFFYMN